MTDSTKMGFDVPRLITADAIARARKHLQRAQDELHALESNFKKQREELIGGYFRWKGNYTSDFFGRVDGVDETGTLEVFSVIRDSDRAGYIYTCAKHLVRDASGFEPISQDVFEDVIREAVNR